MSPRRLLPWACLVAALCALAVGAIVLIGHPSAPAGRARWETTAGEPPTRLRISAIGVDTSLERLGLDARGALRPPSDFGHAGWYADGNRPGDVGPAVIAGHVDSKTGPAVFFRLHELRAGDTVEVAVGERWVKFRVLAVRRYPKNQFPTEDVYAPTPNPQLRLITCGGAFDTSRRSYVDNVVVYAVVS
jgi:LPXTG-site transpeptidase (sortase) family protein